MDFESYIHLLPTDWRDAALALIAFLVGLRTFLHAASGALRGFAGFVSRLDVALDGVDDWRWPKRVARALDVFDSWLDRLPVKSLFARSRK